MAQVFARAYAANGGLHGCSGLDCPLQGLRQTPQSGTEGRGENLFPLVRAVIVLPGAQS